MLYKYEGDVRWADNMKSQAFGNLAAPLMKRFIGCAETAARVSGIPADEIHISKRLFMTALLEAEREVSLFQGRSKHNMISVGKLAACLAYWLATLRPVIIAPEYLDKNPSADRIPELMVLILVTETLLHARPPAAVAAEIVYLLKTRRFTPHSLAVLFDMIILTRNPEAGRSFNELIE